MKSQKIKKSKPEKINYNEVEKGIFIREIPKENTLTFRVTNKKHTPYTIVIQSKNYEKFVEKCSQNNDIFKKIV